MAGWLVAARDAGRAVAGRADLWPAGSVAVLAYLGWLPLLAVVAPTLRGSQLILFGAGLVSASLFPLNLFMIAAAAAALLIVACGLASLGEAAVLARLEDDAGGPSAAEGRIETGSIFAVVLVAMLPVVAAAAALLAGLAVTAPDILTSPDDGATLSTRIMGALGPYVAILACLLLLSQAVGAASMRRAGSGRRRLPAALRLGLMDVLRRPARRLGIAFVTTLLDLIALVVAFALLSILWQPIHARLADGHLLSPVTLIGLLGFVLVWLGLVLAAGAAHAWTSAWWSLELAPDRLEVAA